MSDGLLSCPFCGEAPQLLRDGHTVAHACAVLDREVRTTRQRWNHRAQDGSASPQEGAAMGYQYHVAYVCLSRSGGIGFGSVEVSRPSPLASPGEVTEMGEDIAREQGLERVVVLNVVSFGRVTGPAGDAQTLGGGTP